MDDTNKADGRVVVWRDATSMHEYEDQTGSGGGGGPPTGSAGGVLDGTYPNPGLAAGVAGSGLAETTNVLSVNVDNSTVEINADTVRVKASGITANEIAADAVGSSELADDAVDTNAIQNNAVTAAKVAADVATQAELDAHVNDASDAHDASAISSVAAGNLVATDVQAALNELDTEKTSLTTFNDHSARHENGGADEISIAGLDGTSVELAAHLADTSDAHDASAISVVPFSTIEATTVQAALEEILSEGGGGGPPSGAAGGALDGSYPNPGLAASVAGAGLAETTNVLSVNVDDSSIEIATDTLRVKAGGVTAAMVASDVATQAELDAHINDATAAHAASAISITDAGNDFTATDVEGALDELQADAEADAQALADHIADSSAAHAASAISASSATLSGTATDVQGVLEELDNLLDDHSARHENNGADEISIAGLEGTSVELAAHLADASAAHAASAVSVSSTTLSGTGTDVQAVFEEIDNLLDDHSARHENGGADEISIAGLDGTSTELANHLADSADAHDASAISVVPFETIAATTVQAALEEIFAEASAPVGQLWLSAAGMWPSTTSGAGTNTKTEYVTNDVDIYGIAFDQTAQEFAQITVGMPSDWNGGTVTATFYWTKVGTSTNSVVWGCQGRSFGDAESIDQAFGTEQEVTDAGQATTNQVHISSATGAITLAGTPAASELVQFRVYRDPTDGSDTLAADAVLIGVMIAYSRS